MKPDNKVLIDDRYIQELIKQNQNNGLTKQQGNILIILLILILLTLILNCFFTFDLRELTWLILNKTSS